MEGFRIFVRFEITETGFEQGRVYEVLAIEGGRLLLLNEDARLAWVDESRPTVDAVWRGADRLFDLRVHRNRRRLDSLAGKPVVLTTWENLGFEPDQVTDEAMLVYRGQVESYDGETLFVRRPDGSQFGVLPKAIATIEEDNAAR